jgi:Ca2+-binding RTX toxin-like protein
MRVAAITGAAILGSATTLLAAQPAQAATTATAWVTGVAIMYEAGNGQANSVATAKVFTSTGAVRWQFTDVVPITAGSGCYHPYRSLTLVWCSPGTAMAIGILTLDLNDTVKISSPNTIVYAGAGDDTIHTATDASFISDLYGEAGADTIISGASQDRIDGGAGVDTVSYQNRWARICADLYGWLEYPGGDPVENGCGFGPLEDRYLNDSIENLIGGWNDDELWGVGGTNRLDGGAGADEIYGGGGSDTIYGGTGSDRLYGSGDDVLFGEAGDDVLASYSSIPSDVHDGGDGHDQCKGAMLVINCEVIG